MKAIVLTVFLFCCRHALAQAEPRQNANFNARISFLLFPFTPLLTLEIRTLDKLTLQVETNFFNTHGVNLKYYLENRIDKHYLFSGLALVENRNLRRDLRINYLLYAGYGYVHRFGSKNKWIFDSRAGIGPTINADQNAVYPVIKTGIGRIF